MIDREVRSGQRRRRHDVHFRCLRRQNQRDRARDRRARPNLDQRRLGGEPVFRNLEPVAPVRQAGEVVYTLRIGLKDPIQSPALTPQRPGRSHRRPGRILNLQLNFTSRLLCLE